MTSSALAFVLSLLFAWACFTALGSLTLSLALPSARRRLAHAAPTSRARWLWLLAAAPMLLGVLLVALSLLPSLLGVLWPSLDHCLSHDDHHLHLCLVHWSLQSTPSWLWGGLLGVASAGVALGIRPLRRSLRAHRYLALLSRVATPNRALGASIIDVEQPVAFVHGFINQRLIISRALLDRLDEDALEVVLAHERAHIHRNDNAHKLSARLLSLVHLPRARELLLSDLSLACEQACDDRAAESLGRPHVASVLITVERLCESLPTPMSVSQMGTQLEPRVMALLSPALHHPSPGGTRRRLWITLILGSLLASDLLHHLTESALGWFLR